MLGHEIEGHIFGDDSFVEDASEADDDPRAVIRDVDKYDDQRIIYALAIDCPLCDAVAGEVCAGVDGYAVHLAREDALNVNDLDKLSNSKTEPNPYLEDTLSSLYEEIKSTEEELRAVGKQVEQLSKDVGKAYCDYEEAKGRQDEILEAAERKREAEFRAEFPKATFRPMTDVQRDRYFRRTLSEKYLNWKKKEYELNGVEKYLDALRSISSAKKSRKDLLVPTRSFWQEQSEKE